MDSYVCNITISEWKVGSGHYSIMLEVRIVISYQSIRQLSYSEIKNCVFRKKDLGW